MDDQTAITRIKQGDLNGLEVLVRRYQVKAVHAAFMVIQNHSLAEEIAQNAFLRVYDKIHQFNEDCPFAPWFFRIVINDAIKAARAQNRLSSLEEEPDEGKKEIARWMIDPGPPPEEQVEMKETEETLQQALLMLSAEQRAAVVMRYYLDMREGEMAIRLDKPVSTVKWWLRAARKRLGDFLKPTIDSDDSVVGGFHG